MIASTAGPVTCKNTPKRLLMENHNVASVLYSTVTSMVIFYRKLNVEMSNIPTMSKSHPSIYSCVQMHPTKEIDSLSIYILCFLGLSPMSPRVAVSKDHYGSHGSRVPLLLPLVVAS